MAGLAVCLALAVPALAELDSTKHTDWGVATKGDSATIAQWEALAWEVDQIGGTIYVGGNFLDVTDGDDLVPRPYLAAFDADTGAWQSWFDPAVGNAVFALEPTPDGGLMVGGEIGTWNGATIGSLVKIDPTTGEIWPGWQTRVYGGASSIRDLRLEADGWMYAVGDFSTVTDGAGPITAGGAVRFDPLTGDIDEGWLPTLESGSGWGVSRSPVTGVVYVAGFFQSVNGDPGARGLVGLDDGGAVVVDRAAVPFNGCTTWPYCSQMYDVVATEHGHIWVGGVEHALYVIDETNGELVKMHYTACDPHVNDVCLPRDWYGGEFQEIERIGDRIYATCHCWYDIYSDTTVILHTRPYDNPTATHHTVNAVAAFDASSGDLIPEFAPQLTGDAGGFAVHQNPSDGCLWIAGGFSAYGAPGGPQPAAHDVVRLCDESGPGPAAQPPAEPPPPLECSVSVDPAGPSATVTWTDASTSTGTVIYRSVDGGGTYWRGRVDPPAESVFSEPVPVAAVTDYFAKHVYPGGQRSDAASCGRVDLLPDLVAPAWCDAAVDLDGRARLVWDEGSDAESYVLRRSVDGGTSYWRGRVTGTTFAGATLESGRTYDYTVEARGADGSTTDPVPCTPQLAVEPPPLDPVMACGASLGGPGGATPVLDWERASGALRYIVRRSIDGGPNYWRASMPDTTSPEGSFTFDGVELNDQRSYSYSVTAVGIDGSTAPPTPCTPVLVYTPPPLAAAAACVAEVTGPDAAGSVTIAVSWDPLDDAALDVVVYRSRNGGPSHWRGRIGGADGPFSDSGVESDVYEYEIVVASGGRTSERTPCSTPPEPA